MKKSVSKKDHTIEHQGETIFFKFSKGYWTFSHCYDEYSTKEKFKDLDKAIAVSKIDLISRLDEALEEMKLDR